MTDRFLAPLAVATTASLLACGNPTPPTPEGAVVGSWDVASSSSTDLRALGAASRTNHESPFLDAKTGAAVRFKFATVVEPTHHSVVPVHIDAVLEQNPGAYTVKADVMDPLNDGDLPGGRRDVFTGVNLHLVRKAAAQAFLGTRFENSELHLTLHANGFVHAQPVDDTPPPTAEGTVLGTWDVGHSGACGVKALKTLPVAEHTTTYAESGARPPSGLVLRLDYETAEEPSEHVPVIVSCTVTVEKNPSHFHADLRDEGRSMQLFKAGSEYVLGMTWDYARTASVEGVSIANADWGAPLQLHADGTVREGMPGGKEVE